MSKTFKDLRQQSLKPTPKPRHHAGTLRFKREQAKTREWKSGLELRLGKDD
jgi:hypothetical protein